MTEVDIIKESMQKLGIFGEANQTSTLKLFKIGRM